jgi:hypothetical protein
MARTQKIALYEFDHLHRVLAIFFKSAAASDAMSF